MNRLILVRIIRRWTRRLVSITGLLGVLVVLVLSAACTHAQTINISGVDTSLFPTVRAKLLVADAGGARISAFSPGEITISEEGQTVQDIRIDCPPAGPPSNLSAVLTIDVSESMIRRQGSETHMDIAKSAAGSWISALPTGSQMAITSFDGNSYINADFTSDKNLLTAALGSLSPKGGTSYDAGFIRPVTGAIEVAARGTNKRVIVFLTDGMGGGTESEIVQRAIASNITVFCVAIGMPCPQILKNVAGQTGGAWFEQVVSKDQIVAIYAQILAIARGAEPCNVSWRSTTSCRSNRTLRVTHIPLGISHETTFRANSQSVASLSVVPPSVRFGTRPGGLSYDTTLILRANAADFTVTSTRVLFGGSSFSVVAPAVPFTVPAGQSVNLRVRYSAIDTQLVYSAMELVATPCNATFSASAGTVRGGVRDNPLRLVQPNGGEIFNVGTSAEIRWTGVPATDTVQLEYSIDGGSRWSLITAKATNLSYRWTVPNTPSNRCRVRVAQRGTMGIQQDLARGRVLGGHSEGVRGLFWHPFADRLATAGGRDATTWNANTGVLENRFVGHTRRINDIAWSRDGSLLATASNDFDAILWYADSATIMTTLRNQLGAVNLVAFGADTQVVAVAGADMRLILYWSLIPFATLTPNTISSLEFSSSGDALVTANGRENNAVLWNSRTVARMETFGHNASVNFATFDRPGTRVATASEDGEVKVWNARDGSLIFRLTGHGSSVRHCAWSPDGTMLASVATNGTLRVWSMVDGSTISSAQAHGTIAGQVSFSPDGLLVVTGAFDGSVRVWDPATGDALDRLVGHRGTINEIMWNAKGDLCATASNDSTARIWAMSARPAASDQSDNHFEIVAARFANSRIDMGKVFVGVAKDSLVGGILRPTPLVDVWIDSVVIRGADAGRFALVVPYRQTLLPSSGDHNIELRFLPSRVGMHSAELEVFSQGTSHRIPVQGEGVQDVLSLRLPLVDFGVIDVGQSKDTVVRGILRNLGTRPVRISSATISNPGNPVFRFVSGTADTAFSVAPGDSVSFNLRFEPRQQGRVSGVLSLRTTDGATPYDVTLTGTGRVRGPILDIEYRHGPNIVCEAIRLDTLVFRNTGTGDLIVSNVWFSGRDVTSFAPMRTSTRVPPGLSDTMKIIFRPAERGVHTATINFATNLGVNDTVRLAITERRDSITFSNFTNTILLGDVCSGLDIDTVIRLRYSGSVPAEFSVSNSPEVRSPIQSIVASPGSDIVIPITISTGPPGGTLLRGLSFVEQRCNTTLFLLASWRTFNESINALPALVNQRAMEPDTAFVWLYNTGIDAVTVTGVVGLPVDARVISPQFPVDIAGRDSLPVQIRFEGIDTTRERRVVSFVYGPCALRVNAPIDFTKAGGSLTLSIGSATGRVGQRVSIPITMGSASGLTLDSGEVLEYKIGFNMKMLEPIGPIVGRSQQSGRTTVTYRTPVNAPFNGELARPTFQVLLGNDTTTSLDLSDARLVRAGNTRVALNPGRFGVEGLCEAGGTRLFEDSGMLRLAALPNPSYDDVEITYTVISSDLSRLSVVSAEGSVLQVLAYGVLPAGTYSHRLPRGSLASGAYRVVLENGGMRQSMMLVIP